MSHALSDPVQTDPYLKFAYYVDAVLVSSASIDTKAIRIKSAAALFVGECQAREMRAYEAARTEAAGTPMPRFVKRDNPLLPPPPAVVAPSEPTTEFAPMQPDSETPCPNDDASTATSSTTSNPTAPDAAHAASQQQAQHANADQAAANEDSAGTSPDASNETSATSAPHAANAQAAHGAAANADGPSPKPTRRRLGTR